MTAFGAYSRYYDLFYGDKDYAGEAAFVDGVLRHHGLTGMEILELGCGTGRHAAELVALGYRVHGIDVSETMLEDALSLAEHLQSTTQGLSNLLVVEQGDARSFRAGRVFDAVMSLFHVMSYQTSNEDLSDAITTAAVHLDPGGLFLFDCWYGPAVLTQRPETREKTLEDDAVRVTRIATPVMHPNADVCDVDYNVTVFAKTTGEETVITEKHPMRYLFTPEVALVLSASGFDLVASCEFGTGAPLGFDTWNGCFVARKR